MTTSNEIPVLFFKNQNQWHDWLDKHYTLTSGIWLKMAKKASGIPSVTYDEALDEALCYGWIDGQLKSFDSEYYLQKFTPRRPKSMWSKRNIGKIAELTAAGKMRPSGIAEVDAAQKDGRWEQAYDSPSNMKMPDDFQAALDQNSKAKEVFSTLNKTTVYAFLWRIQTAKTPKTRQARIEKFIQMLNEDNTLR